MVTTMPLSPSQRAAQKAYRRRRKANRFPRPDDIQRAISTSLRDQWRAQIVNIGSAQSLLQSVMKDAVRRLAAKGFDAAESGRRVVGALRPLELAEDGREADVDGIMAGRGGGHG